MPLTTYASLVLGLGVLNGFRTLVPVAVLCWGARLHWFSFQQTPFAFLENPISIGVFSALALGELIGDKLPKTPPRTDLFPVIGRMAFAGACGAALAYALRESPAHVLTGHPTGQALLPAGIIAGALGALIGTFGGFHARRSLTKGAGLPDLPVALIEDAVAVGGSLLIASRF